MGISEIFTKFDCILEKKYWVGYSDMLKVI